MNEKIVHDGIIDRIENKTVFVRIISKSACVSCHSKTMCSVSEMTEKIIEIKEMVSGYEVGQSVKVVLDRSLGDRAVLLGYFIPFCVLILTLLISSSFLNELWAGLLSVAVLFPYYLLLYLFKSRLAKTFSFHIDSR